MQFDPQHVSMMTLIGGVVRDDNGEIRWSVVAAGIIAAGSVTVGGWMVAVSSNVSAIEARQQMVLRRLDSLEASTHPSTSKRYTSEDADRDRSAMQRDISRLEYRLERLEGPAEKRRPR